MNRKARTAAPVINWCGLAWLGLAWLGLEKQFSSHLFGIPTSTLEGSPPKIGSEDFLFSGRPVQNLSIKDCARIQSGLGATSAYHLSLPLPAPGQPSNLLSNDTFGLNFETN